MLIVTAAKGKHRILCLELVISLSFHINPLYISFLYELLSIVQISPAMLPCHMPGSETTRKSEAATRSFTMSPARSHLKTGVLQPSTRFSHWLLMRHLAKRP
jgi:hypothetical protein